MDSSIGVEEQALLQRIARLGGATVGELAMLMQEERGLGRSTVQKMVDRLVAKGWLERIRDAGIFRYHSKRTAEQVDAEVLRQFVQSRFDGSVSPLVSFLNGGTTISDDEMARLKRIVEDWEAGND